MEEVDDEVDEVEADETVLTGSEEAMLDSRSGDMTDSAKSRKIVLKPFQISELFFSFTHWHATPSQPDFRHVLTI